MTLKKNYKNYLLYYYYHFFFFCLVSYKEKVYTSSKNRVTGRGGGSGNKEAKGSSTMKAIVISSPGGPEALKLEEVEDPILHDDEVLINVQATALNRADTLQRMGLYPPPPGASPYPGLECSGTVHSVGPNVSRWKVGDQVPKKKKL